MTMQCDFCSFETRDVFVFAANASNGHTELKVLHFVYLIQTAGGDVKLFERVTHVISR
jgi:hypothetical protein